MRRTLVLAAMCCLISLKSVVANDPRSTMVFIYDASGSMWGRVDGSTKMEIAASVLSDALDGLPAQQQVALVAFGHRVEGDCRDVEFLVDMDNDSRLPVKDALNSIKPLGKTPLAYSANLVLTKLRDRQTPATIILLTDGIESCDGDICSIVGRAKTEGLDFRMHIIGFGLQQAQTAQLRCAAKAGGGRYFDASNADDLVAVLDDATSSTVDTPPGNFSLFVYKNGKPVDAYISVRESQMGTPVTAARTYGDTALFHVPAGMYDMEVKPLEGSDVSAVLLGDIQVGEDGTEHRDVSFDSGEIVVNALNNGLGWDTVVKVYPLSGKKIVAGGRTYGSSEVFEVDPGMYDVELQAMNIRGSKSTQRIEGVEVKAGVAFDLTHNFESGELLLGAHSDNGLVDATINIVDPDLGASVAAGRTYTSSSSNPKLFLLSPGEYTVTVTALGAYKGAKKTLSLAVRSGEKVEKTVAF